MIKNYNYILTIMLYPFLLLLEFLMLKGILKSNLYLYLILIMFLIFVPSFIMSLYNASEEILSSKRKWRIILLIFFSFIYLPIYYTKYVAKEEKYLGVILCILSLILSYFTYDYFNKWSTRILNSFYRDSYAVSSNFTYITSDGLFAIDISNDFRCKNSDIGDYVISCDKEDDDSFIGIYRYNVTDDSEQDIIDLLDFHLNQSLEYINENGYEGIVNDENEIIEIDYHDMVILLTQKNYLVNGTKYSLIIIKEMPKELENIEEYEKMIETVNFLNYNVEESS